MNCRTGWIACATASLIAIAGCTDATAPTLPIPAAPRHALVTTATPMISAGQNHTCALKSDGTLACWGDNSYGQTTIPAGLSNVSAVSAGAYHTCALKSDRTVSCWGDNSFGETTVPAGLPEVSAVSAGGDHTCALISDSSIICWGSNSYQQSDPIYLNGASAVSAGYSHTCALKFDRTVACAGYNFGRLFIPNVSNVAAISAGDYDTCAVRFDGTVACWGRNYYGEATVPAGLSQVEMVDGGAGHTCAVKLDGTVVCWGFNGSGQATVPAGLAGVEAVAAGGSHSCALTFDGNVVCWGNNDYGQTTVPANLNLQVWVPDPQTITFTSSAPASAVVGGTYQVAATGGASGNAVTFSSLSSSICTVSSAAVTFVGAGNCTVAADQAGNSHYLAAGQVTQTFAVGLGSQSVSFTSIPQTPALEGGSYTVSATGGASGNQVTFSSLTGSVCTVSGSSVSLLIVGTCTVAADQAQGAGYNAAAQVTQSFSVNSAAQAINFTSTPPDPAVVGGIYSVSATGGSSGNAVTFSSSTPDTCTVSGGSVSLTGAGTCTVAADQAAGSGYRTATQVTQTFALVGAPGSSSAFSSDCRYAIDRKGQRTVTVTWMNAIPGVTQITAESGGSTQTKLLAAIARGSWRGTFASGTPTYGLGGGSRLKDVSVTLVPARTACTQ